MTGPHFRSPFLRAVELRVVEERESLVLHTRGRFLSKEPRSSREAPDVGPKAPKTRRRIEDGQTFARFMLDNRATYAATAKAFGVSEATVKRALQVYRDTTGRDA